MGTLMNLYAQFLIICLIFIAIIIPVSAQQHPPNGPHIPAITLTGGTPSPEQPPPPGPRDIASTWNTDQVGYNDLQGHSAYQPLIINQDGHQIAYVGHHNQKALLNPLTGQMEKNGTSILDVTEPADTKYLAHIPTGSGRGEGGSQMVQVCSGSILPHRRYLVLPT